jgi:uncharacterized radical SAM superfamily Fe-S cluster-containing enzyme
VLREDDILIPTTHFGLTQRDSRKNAAERSKEYIRRHWKYYETDSAGIQQEGSRSDFGDVLKHIHSHSLCISGMAFQDAWNIDLERLRRCCIHVITASKKLIPFCAYYMTDSSGRRLVDQRASLFLK